MVQVCACVYSAVYTGLCVHISCIVVDISMITHCEFFTLMFAGHVRVVTVMQRLSTLKFDVVLIELSVSCLFASSCIECMFRFVSILIFVKFQF